MAWRHIDSVTWMDMLVWAFIVIAWFHAHETRILLTL